ncbi:hypothetical protein [Clostridium sp.]|uniref:hypothetical protein n=1 Tax=Clostridium sp. TaxID=1506 RepID=UPI0039F4E893
MKLYTRRTGTNMGTGRIEIEDPRELVDIETALKQYRKQLDRKTQTNYVMEQKSEIDKLIKKLEFRNALELE